LGKSQITASIAAIVTSGGTWPVETARCTPGDVVFCTAEDDPADTLRPQLEAAGADIRRIHVVDGVIVGYRGDGVREDKGFSIESRYRPGAARKHGGAHLAKDPRSSNACVVRSTTGLPAFPGEPA
jgi:hypothetical protein